jgi:hypothetical protein
MVRPTLALLVVVAACAHPPPAEAPTKWESAASPDAAYALSHLRGIDARLAARAATSLDGPRALQDPYLFADRRERLVAMRGMLPPPLSMADHAGEPALTLQLVDEEVARIDDESDDIARSSVDLLATLLASDDSDDWVSFRVDEIRDALVREGISEPERQELLEIARGARKRPEGSHGAEAISRLVRMLENANAAPLPLLERSVYRRRVEFQTRMFVSPDAIAPAIERARASLEAQIDAAFSVLGPRRASRMRGHAALLLSDPPRCAARVPVRVAADLAPPPERARACGLASALASAWTDEAEVVALLAMYESVVTACRAIALHDRRLDIAASNAACPRISIVDEPRELRLAANHPVTAVVGGLAIALLFQDGAAHAPSRARRWIRFGDVPLHVLELVVNGETG